MDGSRSGCTGKADGQGWSGCYLGTNGLRDPFFDYTIGVEVQTPFNMLFRYRTPLEELAEWRRVSPGVAPAGFIFHLSRCGSTLITQMLASLPENLVLSEPGVMEMMMRAGTRAPGATLEQRAGWLRDLVSALGQRRSGLEQRLFLKFDPRSTLDFELIRLAFPEVPWIFVYRDPVEVMVSNLRAASPLITRGIADAAFLRMSTEEIAGIEDDEYAARVFGARVPRRSARHAEGDHGGMVIAYPNLPASMWGTLTRHFGLSLTAAEVAQLGRVSGLPMPSHPQEPFVSDIPSKQREATERIRGLAEQWLRPHYAALEQLRQTQSAARFGAFREWMLRDPALLASLRGLPRETFLEASLTVAGQAGLSLDRADLDLALAEASFERTTRVV